MQTSDRSERRCRFCRAPLKHVFVDLGVSPLANSYLRQSDLGRMEPFYPLIVYVCSSCYLVQLEELGRPGEIFSEYAYFSSVSSSWLEHARSYAAMARERFGLGEESLVIEVGSNDGYLLRFFREAGIPVLGVEPAANVASEADKAGVPTLVRFFDGNLANELVASGRKADLVIGNNVLAHIPATNDFLAAVKTILKPGGVITMEFPSLLNLIEEKQFDTIYHEHYSYYSLTTIVKIFAVHDLEIFDVDRLNTHGGSLRIYAQLSRSTPGDDRRIDQQNGEQSLSGALACNGYRHVDTEGQARVTALLAEEKAKGLQAMATYEAFGAEVQAVKRRVLQFMIAAREEGKTIAGYGAPAKGVTLLNYCGIGRDFIDYTVDLNPYKQGLYLPGCRIPIYAPEKIMETKPDYLLILPWNLKEEITSQMKAIRAWGGRFVTLIPEVACW